MSVKIVLNERQIKDKVTNDKLGLFVAETWYKLISPYTPRDSGNLEDHADRTKPWKIIYKAKSKNGKNSYAKKVYYGDDLNFSHEKNIKATSHWDKRAEEEGKKTILYNEINQALKQGRF